MPSKFESTEVAAIAYDKNVLLKWYNKLKVLPYQDGNWHKQFKQGSKLEWFNPLEWSDYCGIQEAWTTENYIENFLIQNNVPLIADELIDLISPNETTT